MRTGLSNKQMFILIGASGSGKTTYTKNLIHQAEMDCKKIAVYSLDTLRLAAYHIKKNNLQFKNYNEMCKFVFNEFVPDNSKYTKSWEFCSESPDYFNALADAYLVYLVSEKYDIIVDNVNATKSARKKFVSAAKQKGYFVTASYFMVSKTALENSAKRRTDKKVPIEAVMSQYSKIAIPSIGSEVDDIDMIYRVE